MKPHFFVVAAALLALAAAGPARAVDDPGALLPANPGKELVLEHCQACHSVTLLVQQRISEKAWTGELVKMEKWGSTLPPEQNALVASYLAKYFNPDTPDAPARMVPSPKRPG
jgi:mono/diheme cytochrome c family protein